jgi:exoribonuclease-2
MLVSELMIMNNDLAARYLADNKMPAIFRCQAEPRERLVGRDQSTLFQNWMQRRLISRFILNSAPEPHSGLGLAAYVTASSPIRKYTDLVTQRQLRATQGMEPAYQKNEMDYLIASLRETLSHTGRIQYRRNRYWLLKYLEGHVGQKEEGLVLHKRRDGHVILMPEFMIECQLSGAENIKLKPEDLVQVTLQHVNARNDVITVYLG